MTALPLLALLAVAATESAPPAGADRTSTPAYWLAASDGGIFSFGGAPYYGSTGGMVLNKPVVGIAATSDGGGYYEVASDGGVFSYGDATFYGSTGSIRLNQPIVGMAVTPGGDGYWLVASDGGIFSFGDGHVLRQHRQHPAQQAGRRHGGHAERARVLAGGFGRRHLQLRRRLLPRQHRQPGAQQADHRHDHGAGRRRLFPGGLGRRASSASARRPSTARSAGRPSSTRSWRRRPHRPTTATGSPTPPGWCRTSGRPTTTAPRRRTSSDRSSAWRRRPGTGSFIGGTYPSGAYGYDISTYQCASLPPRRPTRSASCRWTGAPRANPNPCLSRSCPGRAAV